MTREDWEEVLSIALIWALMLGAIILEMAS